MGGEDEAQKGRGFHRFSIEKRCMNRHTADVYPLIHDHPRIICMGPTGCVDDAFHLWLNCVPLQSFQYAT